MGFTSCLPSQALSHPGDTRNFGSRMKLDHVFKCKNELPREPFDDF